MKYICLGYYDKSKHDAMTEAEKHAMFDACFTFDGHLRANGHWGGGEAIQPAETALTLYWKNGKVKVALGVGKGKAQFDKREDLKEREADRELKRATMKAYKGR